MSAAGPLVRTSLRTFLDEIGFDVAEVERDILGFPYDGANGSWGCLCQVVEEHRLLVVRSVFPATLASSAVLHLDSHLMRLSCTLSVGAFESDPKEGSVRLRTWARFPDDEPAPALAGAAVFDNLATMDTCIPHIKAALDPFARKGHPTA